MINKVIKSAQLHKRRLIFWAVFLLALFLRTILFPAHPGGLNQDEASIGYDAWALLNYGIDRNNQSWPVHFMSWGSGQNALYAYLSMPFIALFGLNVFSVRCVNYIFGLVGIVAVYFIGKRIAGSRIGLICMGLAAIAPWHIMLSRWGLESNLFPAMLALSLWTLLEALERKKLLYLFAVVGALSLYAYGSAYLVITLFVALSFLYILWKKLLPWKTVILSGLVFLAAAFPIYLFVLVNLFHLGEIHLWIFTIPQNRVERLSSVSEGLSLRNVIQNIYDLVILQTDHLERNVVPLYGCLYIISLPFFIRGVISTVTEKCETKILLLILFFCAFSLFFVYDESNINRLNALYFPMILFTGIGIGKFIQSKQALTAIAAAYALLLAGFSQHYFSESYRNNLAYEFYDSLGEAILQAEEVARENEPIYITHNVNMPYIFTLFYTQTSPGEFYETSVVANPDGEFQYILYYDRYVFNTLSLYEGVPGIYVLPNYEVIDLELSPEYSFTNFSVVIIR